MPILMAGKLLAEKQKKLIKEMGETPHWDAVFSHEFGPFVEQFLKLLRKNFLLLKPQSFIAAYDIAMGLGKAGLDVCGDISQPWLAKNKGWVLCAPSLDSNGQKPYLTEIFTNKVLDASGYTVSVSPDFYLHCLDGTHVKSQGLNSNPTAHHVYIVYPFSTEIKFFPSTLEKDKFLLEMENLGLTIKMWQGDFYVECLEGAPMPTVGEHYDSEPPPDSGPVPPPAEVQLAAKVEAPPTGWAEKHPDEIPAKPKTAGEAVMAVVGGSGWKASLVTQHKWGPPEGLVAQKFKPYIKPKAGGETTLKILDPKAKDDAGFAIFTPAQSAMFEKLLKEQQGLTTYFKPKLKNVGNEKGAVEDEAVVVKVPKLPKLHLTYLGGTHEWHFLITVGEKAYKSSVSHALILEQHWAKGTKGVDPNEFVQKSFKVICANNHEITDPKKLMDLLLNELFFPSKKNK